MVQVYLHCSSTDGILFDRRGTAVSSLTEARGRAIILMPGAEDWRDWVLHVSGDDGEELFDLPFTSILGKPH